MAPRDITTLLALLVWVGFVLLWIYFGARDDAPRSALLAITLSSVAIVPVILYGRWLTGKLEKRRKEEDSEDEASRDQT